MGLLQKIFKSEGRLPLDSIQHDFMCNKRVAVTIATDPASDLEDRRNIDVFVESDNTIARMDFDGSGLGYMRQCILADRDFILPKFKRTYKDLK